MKRTYNKLIKGLQDYFKKTGFRRGIVGLSGGIDSSVTFKLAVEALGSQNVIAVMMPELGLSAEENLEHAKGLAHYFKVKSYIQPINGFLAPFQGVSWRPSRMAKMNTKARIRSVLLYNLANTEKALVLGTSNKSETLLGYGTKYGDLAADLEVIGDLYKTDVYKLAEFMHLPQAIIDKAPTAELEEGQTDEGELGASYTVLDEILKLAEDGKTASKIAAAGYPNGLIDKVLTRIEANRHKSEMPPILKAF